MTIEGIDYDDIYGDVLSREHMLALDYLGVEWRGRNVLEVYHDTRTRAIELTQTSYEQAVATNSPHTPYLKSLMDYVIEQLPRDFDVDGVNEDSPPQYDPASGTYRVLVKADKKKKWWWIVGAVVVGTTVTILTANPAAGAAAAGATASAATSTSSNRRHANDKKPSAPSPSTALAEGSFLPPTPPIPQIGPTPPIASLARSPTLTPAELNAGRPPNFNTPSWTPPTTVPPLALQSPINPRPHIETSPFSTPSNYNARPHIELTPSNILPKNHPYSPANQVSFAPPFHLPRGPGALIPDATPISHQELAERALAIGDYPQAVQAFGKAIGQNPTSSNLYLGRGIAHFGMGQYDQSLGDYQNYNTQVKDTHPFLAIEFTKGFAKGLPQGIHDSGKGLFFFVADVVKHPINTGSQVWESLTLLSQLVRSGEWSTLGITLAPEVYQLVQEWDTLPSDKRGELAGYAFGKYGADILLPGAAAKVISKGLKGAQELSIVCRGLKTAEQTLILESAAEFGSGTKVGEVIQAHQARVALGSELAVGTREGLQLQQAGRLGGTVAPRLGYSAELFERAVDTLKPEAKKIMPENTARALIHKTGMPTFPRPAGVPENFRVNISKKGAGMRYTHPEHNHTSIRVMPGDPQSKHPHQQQPYVIHQKDGKILDKFGNVVLDRMAPEAHIPLEEFVYGG